MRGLLRLLLCLGLVGCATAMAQPDTGPAFDVEAATQAYVARLDARQRAASDAYFEGQYWLLLWDWLYTLVIAWLLLHFGFSTRLRNLSERVSRASFLQHCVYIPLFLLTVFVLSLPLSIYRDFIREHEYGLSNLSFLAWFGEQLIGLGLLLVIGTPAIAVLYVLLRKARRTWIAWASTAGVALLGLLFMVSPVYIQPLFNDYRPLADGPLKERILSLARANGVPAGEVYQFDASRQTSRISANVSGLFGTARISLNDNLLNRVSPAGVEAAMGHEIGHYALNHGPRHVLELGLVLALGFVVVNRLFDRLNRSSWRIRGLDDIAGLPLVMAILYTYGFLMTPVINTIIRVAEVEADIYGLNAARQPDGWAEDVLLLSEYRKVHPGYWEEILFYDHPSGYERLRMGMHWKKENLDRP